MISVLVAFIFLITTTTLCFVAMVMIMICSLMMPLIYCVSYATNSIVIVKWILLFDDEFIIGLLLLP